MDKINLILSIILLSPFIGIGIYAGIGHYQECNKLQNYIAANKISINASYNQLLENIYWCNLKGK